MGEEYIVIQAGVPTVLEDDIVFLGVGSAGTRRACRRLVFPAAVSPLLAPITYATAGRCMNPTRTINLDNEALLNPSAQAIKTLGSTRVVRFDEALEDVVVQEVWSPTGGASMPTFLFRLLYEYWLNAPAYTIAGTDFIQWEPRDRTTKVYNVELVGLVVGGRDGYDVADLKADGGRWDGGDYDTGLDKLNATLTGLVDTEVRLTMRIVSEAP